MFKIRLADCLPPHVNSVRSRLLDSCRHVLLLVIDGSVGAQLPADLYFLIAPGSRDHVRRQRFRHLHNHRADTPCTAVDKKRFAALKLRLAHQAQMRGEAHQSARGNCLIAKTIRNWIQPAFIHRGVLRKSALPPMSTLVRSPYSIADFVTLRLRTNLFDNSRQVATADKWQWKIHLNHAAAYIRIDGIKCGSLHAYEHLAAHWLGSWQFTDDDVFRRTRLIDVCSFHDGLLQAHRRKAGAQPCDSASGLNARQNVDCY